MADELIAKVLEHYGADLTRISTVGWRPVKCPFHEDRTASASVNLNLGGFRCHACGMHGNAVTLIMEKEVLDYRAACDWAQSVLGAGEFVQQSTRRKSKRRRSKWRDRLAL